MLLDSKCFGNSTVNHSFSKFLDCLKNELVSAKAVGMRQELICNDKL